jgi:hypothetical protein
MINQSQWALMVNVRLTPDSEVYGIAETSIWKIMISIKQREILHFLHYYDIDILKKRTVLNSF